MNLVSLFSGSGQLDRAVHAALAHFGIRARTVAYVESNKAAHEVIRARVRDGLLQDAPIWPDVVTFPGRRLRGYVDGIVAGFPCQPFSVAGKKLGIEDERYLFGDVVRIADESDARLLFLENTPGLLIPDSKRPDEPAPISDVSRLMAQSGFDCAWLPLSAADVGAPHGRERWWCIAWRELAHAGLDAGCAELQHESGSEVGRGPCAADADSPGATIHHNPRGTDSVSAQAKAWATPQAHDVAQGDAARIKRHGTKSGDRNLTDEVMKWPSPRTTDANGSGKHGRGGQTCGLASSTGRNWSTPVDDDANNVTRASGAF